MTVDVSVLPPGSHRLAVLTADGALVGWAPVTIPALPVTGQVPVNWVLALAAAMLLSGAGAMAINVTRRSRVRNYDD